MSTPDTGWSLRSDREFFQQAKRQSSRFFLAYFLPHSTFESAVIVSKTVAPLATDRNKLKRQVKNILAKNTTPLLLKLAIVVKRQATQATFAELEADLHQLLRTL